MSEIAKKLRSANAFTTFGQLAKWNSEAADELERLESQLDALRQARMPGKSVAPYLAKIQSLQSRLDAVTAAMKDSWHGRISDEDLVARLQKIIGLDTISAPEGAEQRTCENPAYSATSVASLRELENPAAEAEQRPCVHQRSIWDGTYSHLAKCEDCGAEYPYPIAGKPAADVEHKPDLKFYGRSIHIGTIDECMDFNEAELEKKRKSRADKEPKA